MSENTTETLEGQEQVDGQGAESGTEGKQERTFTRSDIAKMISAERAKWENEQAEAVEKAKSEGERLAKMTKDERAKEEEAKRLSELEAREQAIARKELRVETQTLLSEEGLPAEFIDIVMADTAEDVKTNISNVAKVFDAAVEQRVNERITQTQPRTGAPAGAMSKAEIMAIKDDSERQRLIAENLNLFKRS